MHNVRVSVVKLVLVLGKLGLVSLLPGTVVDQILGVSPMGPRMLVGRSFC